VSVPTVEALRAYSLGMLEIAEQAGALLMGGYRTRPRPESKSAEADLVTEFDRKSEALVLAELGRRYPGVRVVGEESTQAGASTGPFEGLVFYVDPLDGTTNFVHGVPTFCVSIGLTLDDRPVAGAVLAPALGIAWRGFVSGAVRELVRSDRFSSQPARVSATRELGQALVATGFPPRCDGPPHDNFDSFMRVQRVVRGVRRAGSAATDLAMVADGTYDAFWERNLKPWDLIGGSALVLAGGGRVSSFEPPFDRAEPDWHRGSVLASNGLVHDAVAEKIEPTTPRG
jgi:myo-inositol-1(or 4)-monophosphatase